MALVLENSLLHLKIEEPGQVYHHSRFDWTGNISHVLFENKFDFCSSETTSEFDVRLHCRGYSTKLIKKIRLSGNSVTIEYKLENTGRHKIQTNEYCHNFIAINRSNIDEHYSLRVPCKINKPSAMTEAVNPENAVILHRNSVNFNFTPERDFLFSPLTEFHPKTGEWEIAHDSIGVGMKETTDFIPEMMNVWGLKHVISPELFIKIDLEPGQELKWQRRYEFYYVHPVGNYSLNSN